MIVTLAILLAAQVVIPDAESAGIMGTPQACDNEGEEVPKKSINIPDLHCFTCMCKNGFVECQKDGCPSLKHCYMLLESKDGCCQNVCKGCIHNGVRRSSGTEWRDTKNPCRVFRCESGVVTESDIQCYTPCQNPNPPSPGQCCSTCPGCRINGQQVMDDRNVTIPEDPCLKCQCERGRMMCQKRACPVLQCPLNSTFNVSGECCPRCADPRPMLDLPRGECMLGKLVHKPGHAYYPDRCTHCSCVNGTSVCRRTACPILECAPEMQYTAPGHCCPQCSPVLESQASCTIGGHTYEDGESWELGPCKSCLCRQGQVRCAMAMCPTCPPNFKVMHKPGECCQKCVESDGVCTVFGDPHYRTFDGKFYSFQGSCKYQLSTDCVGRSFSIRVTNDARATKASSWTKTISIKVGELKVNLGQKMRVKVNGKRIEPPYHLQGKVSINKTDESVMVGTHLGVNVLWDGHSFLEVSVPTAYKGKLCGLCGDFNSNSRDDFTTRRGRLVQDPDKFGTSWRVGGKKACARPHEDLSREPLCQQPAMHKHNYKQCEPLKRQMFAPCHKKIPYMNYIRACMTDMCECPNGRCFCESFTAYAHECQRVGVHLRKWRTMTGCTAGWNHHRRPLPPRLH